MSNSEATKSSPDKAALVICPDQGMMSELVPLLTYNLAGVQLIPAKTYPDSEALTELTGNGIPRLCYLDVYSDSKRAQEVLADLLVIEPGMQVVVLLGSDAPELILRFLRQGASEFLTRPFAVEDLKPVLARLSQLSSAINYGKGAKVISVAPTKGACGASTIACNLAYQRKRLGSEKMLLADLDPLTGTISFLLKVKSNYNFMDALSRSPNLDEDLWKGMVTPSDGVDVLLSPDNPVDGIHDLHDPTPIIEFARQLYDTVIVDSANVIGEWGLALATICDEFLLITTNELPALQATQRVLAYLERNRVERSKIRLVVNRYSREVGLSKDAIATALHSDVFHIIPSDYESVHRALVDGKPIPPGSAFGKSLIGLADRLGGKKPETVQKSKGRLGGIFSSLFSRNSS